MGTSASKVEVSERKPINEKEGLQSFEYMSLDDGDVDGNYISIEYIVQSNADLSKIQGSTDINVNTTSKWEEKLLSNPKVYTARPRIV